jgi:hypothetical protein
MLIKAINDYLRDRPKDERARHCFHPSSLHKSPEELLKLYYAGDNSQEFPPRTLRIFDNGHHVHDRLQRYLTEARILLQAEVPVHHEKLEIRGHTDGIVEIFGQRGILEIKSIGSTYFYELEGPKYEHLIQVHAYMLALDLPRAVLLYECKDNQELKEFFFAESPDIREKIIAKIRTVQGWIAEGRKS